MLVQSLGQIVCAVGLANAAAIAHSPATDDVAARGLLSPILDTTQLTAAISDLESTSRSLNDRIATGKGILNAIVPAAPPSSANKLVTKVNSIVSLNPGDFLKSAFEILLNGLAGGDYLQIAASYLVESNGNNINLKNPRKAIYPKATAGDAPYSLSEADLRKVIHIPLTFTYGKISPLIFIPGTASVAGQAFGPNYGKLFAQNKLVDPVYVNIPHQNLDDIQVNAEYVAYAINYISGISGNKNVSDVGETLARIRSKVAEFAVQQLLVAASYLQISGPSKTCCINVQHAY